MKASAVAPSNIAFIKYWGKKDDILRLPENGSVSMNLSNLITTTTVEFNSQYKNDVIIINKTQKSDEESRVIKQLDKIRTLAKLSDKAKVVSENNFPTATGLSSSASGFAALTVAGATAAGLNLSEKELSILARQGSGSACRSIPDGFVEWLKGDTNETSYAISLYPPEYWDIVDIVAVVSVERKEVSSTKGHTLATTSPFFEKRLEGNPEKIRLIKQYLKEKNFTAFGELVEKEALELHAVYMTSHPSLLYLLPESLRLLHLVRKWRRDGLEVYFTLNTGQDVHIICRKKIVEKAVKKILECDNVQNIIVNYPAKGTRVIQKHLF